MSMKVCCPYPSSSSLFLSPNFICTLHTLGQIDVDQAQLTGESLPVTMFAGDSCMMGSTVVRGKFGWSYLHNDEYLIMKVTFRALYVSVFIR